MTIVPDAIIPSIQARARATLALAALLTALGVGAACRRQPDPPPKPPPPPLEYLGEWGIKGDGPGQLSHPVSLATDSAGRVYVADMGSGFVHKFGRDGGPLLSFQDPAVAAPNGIALDRGGAIYVADPVHGSVIIFDPDGTRFRVIRCAPRRSAKEALGVAVDDDGNVFVVDPQLDHVQKFNVRGRLLARWGRRGNEPGELSAPGHVTIGPDGFLYVADTGNRRVVKFTRDGEFVGAFNPPGGDAIVGLAGLTVSAKYVFAADPYAHTVHVWTLDGQYKLFDALGNRLASTDPVPADVALSPGSELLVLDPIAARVLRFRINL